MTPIAPDPHLLSLARRILERHNFRVQERRLDIDDASWLLAESEYFVLGVAAGQTLDDLLVLEGFVTDAMGRLLSESNLGAKRWDSYVVLMASSDADLRGRPDVVRLQYNTRSLRRILSLGTAAHEDAVTEALLTFLPLPEPPAGGLPSAFDELVEQLMINGISEEQATAAVSSYRSAAGIDG